MTLRTSIALVVPRMASGAFFEGVIIVRAILIVLITLISFTATAELVVYEFRGEATGLGCDISAPLCVSRARITGRFAFSTDRQDFKDFNTIGLGEFLEFKITFAKSNFSVSYSTADYAIEASEVFVELDVGSTSFDQFQGRQITASRRPVPRRFRS